jgi:hypothetical protein
VKCIVFIQNKGVSNHYTVLFYHANFFHGNIYAKNKLDMYLKTWYSFCIGGKSNRLIYTYEPKIGMKFAIAKIMPILYMQLSCQFLYARVMPIFKIKINLIYHEGGITYFRYM